MLEDGIACQDAIHSGRVPPGDAVRPNLRAIVQKYSFQTAVRCFRGRSGRSDPFGAEEYLLESRPAETQLGMHRLCASQAPRPSPATGTLSGRCQILKILPSRSQSWRRNAGLGLTRSLYLTALCALQRDTAARGGQSKRKPTAVRSPLISSVLFFHNFSAIEGRNRA